jgi:Fe-S cluster assembly protein SufD
MTTSQQDKLAHPLLASVRERLASNEDFLALDVPGRKDEEWRFVRLDGVMNANVSVAKDVARVEPKALIPFAVPEAKGRALVFVDGVFAKDLSDLSALGDLSLEVTDKAREEVGNLAALQLDGKDYFSALNTATYNQRVDISVGKDVSAGTVHLLHVRTGGEGRLVVPRVFVEVGLGSKLTLVEEHVSLDKETEHVTNALVEVEVAANATVQHVKVQDENLVSHHIARTALRVAEGANYTSVTITFGAAFSRHDLHAQIEGGNSVAGLHGLAKISGRQIADTHSVMNHAHPHADSDQLHKCVVDDRGHAVFNGKIFVRQIAQQTNAFQLNRNLLLSDRAKVDTKPQLEIFADDVKCTHGATIGQLDEDQLFYLQARGIPANAAANLLTYAFAAEVVERVPVLSVRKRLAGRISPANG